MYYVAKKREKLLLVSQTKFRYTNIDLVMEKMERHFEVRRSRVGDGSKRWGDF